MNTFPGESASWEGVDAVSYTHLRAHETGRNILPFLIKKLVYLLLSVVSDSCLAAAIITPKHIAAVTKVNRTSMPDEPAHVK